MIAHFLGKCFLSKPQKAVSIVFEKQRKLAHLQFGNDNVSLEASD
jgi:hypothetical protein